MHPLSKVNHHPNILAPVNSSAPLCQHSQNGRRHLKQEEYPPPVTAPVSSYHSGHSILCLSAPSASASESVVECPHHCLCHFSMAHLFPCILTSIQKPQCTKRYLALAQQSHDTASSLYLEKHWAAPVCSGRHLVLAQQSVGCARTVPSGGCPAT